MHIVHALRISDNNNESFAELVQFVTDPAEIAADRIWLQRIRERMTGNVKENAIDFEYLSRFEVKMICGDTEEIIVDQWNEWIEPLTLHMRHPLSYFEFIHKPELIAPDSVYATDVNYILLQSRINIDKLRDKGQPHMVILDAGSGPTFNSSSKWLACAYAQQGLYVDELFSWEVSPVNVQDWIGGMPQEYKSVVNFSNSGIDWGREDVNNPLRKIKAEYNESDFIVFKLDIDNQEIEIPLVAQLKRDEDLHKLVDEFFFEFHHTCTALGRTETEYMGIGGDRGAAIELFKALREMGIRAHVWP